MKNIKLQSFDKGLAPRACGRYICGAVHRSTYGKDQVIAHAALQWWKNGFFRRLVHLLPDREWPGLVPGLFFSPAIALPKTREKPLPSGGGMKSAEGVSLLLKLIYYF